MKSGRPAHASVRLLSGNSTLVMAGGRPALGVWESPDLGETWAVYDLPTEHNRLMKEESLRFCPQFENAALDGSLGWTQSSAVTAVAVAGPGRFVVCYDRVCCPTVRTDCHKAPPAGCGCEGTQFFCMAGRAT